MKLTLKDINEAVTAKYSPLELELSDGTVVVMRPALRMKDKERADLAAMQSERNKVQAAHDRAVKAYEAAVEAGDEAAVEPEDKTDLEGYIKSLITLTVGDSARSEALLAEVGDDLAFLIEIVTNYSKSTQPGEASTSES